MDGSGGIKQGSGLYWVIGLESLKIVPATLEGHSAAMVCIEMTLFTEQEWGILQSAYSLTSLELCPDGYLSSTDK